MKFVAHVNQEVIVKWDGAMMQLLLGCACCGVIVVSRDTFER
jgi:hypothetical protein